jgi:hypothetical protein
VGFDAAEIEAKYSNKGIHFGGSFQLQECTGGQKAAALQYEQMQVLQDVCVRAAICSLRFNLGIVRN